MDYYYKLAKDIIEGSYQPNPGAGLDIAGSRDFNVPDEIFENQKLMELAKEDVQRLREESNDPDYSTKGVLHDAIQLAVMYEYTSLKQVSFKD